MCNADRARSSYPGARICSVVVAGLIVAFGVPLKGTTWAQPLGGEFQVNTYTTGDQTPTEIYGGTGSDSVATDPAGNFVVVWQSQGDGSGLGVFGRRYDSSGAPQGSEFQVNTFTSGTQRNPAVAADGSGNVIVVWSGNGTPSGFVGLYGQRYSSSGATLGAEFTVSTGHYEYHPDVAADAAGNFVVVWQDIQDGSSSGVRGQRFDSGGSPVGAQFQVNSTTGGGQGSPSVAISSTGDFVVVWDGDGPSTTDIFGQRYNSSGTAQGSEFLVNTYTTSFQRLPSVAADSAGNFVVTWQEYSYPPRNISARRFSSSGSPLGAEFKVNTTTPGTQGDPAVAADPAGNFVVVWDSFASEDGSYRSVHGQRYNSAGSAMGVQFLVNTYTTGHQRRPGVAVDATGNFVVVWTSGNQDGSGWGMFGQRYFSCGNGTVGSGEACDLGPSNGNPAVCCTASCTFVAGGTECRISAGVCDPAETCTGASGSCPPDAKSTAECRAAADVCDLADSCDGVGDVCPPDAKKPSGTGCTPDGNVCTDDVCDGVGNACTHPNNTAACDDLLFCNGSDTCAGGGCNIHAGDPCVGPDGDADCSESCDEGADDCTAADPSGSACSDSLFCNGADTCGGGTCSGHAGDPCAGGPECADACNEAADNCLDPSGTSCTDDGNACTADECDGAGGCDHPNTTDQCDDGDACTMGDTCGGGACSGTAITSCIDADGCCPSGCDTVDDSDCPPPLPVLPPPGALLLGLLLAAFMAARLRGRRNVAGQRGT